MIEHKHRYSHLRKYVWQIQPPTANRGISFRGLKSNPVDSSRMRVLHPMSALLLGGRAIPSDLALEAQDCLSLYAMIRQCVSQGKLDHLAPEVYFDSEKLGFLKQADVIRYEAALKDLVLSWMKAPNADAANSPYQKLVNALQNDMNRGGPMEALEDAYPQQVAISQLIDLLHKLDSDGDLVSILFAFGLIHSETLPNSLAWRSTLTDQAAKTMQKR